MPSGPKSKPPISRYNQQRMQTTQEQSLPDQGPASRLLTAVVAEYYHEVSLSQYHRSDHAWADALNRATNADPLVQSTQKLRKEIKSQIEELRDFENTEDKINHLKSELKETDGIYAQASRRAQNDPQVKRAEAVRKQCQEAVEKCWQDLQAIRQQSLAEMRHYLGINLTWDQVESFLSQDLKKELQSAEIALTAATIDRQEALTAANQAIIDGLEKLQQQ